METLLSNHDGFDIATITLAFAVGVYIVLLGINQILETLIYRGQNNHVEYDEEDDENDDENDSDTRKYTTTTHFNTK